MKIELLAFGYAICVNFIVLETIVRIVLPDWTMMQTAVNFVCRRIYERWAILGKSYCFDHVE
jgi:hypothetical protein